MSEEPSPPPQISDEDIKRPEFSWRPIEELIPYNQNPRAHNEEDIRLLMHSLAYYGWRNPVQIAKGTNLIVAGHGRVEAARRLGLKNIPCMESADTDENHRGYRIMDNKSAEMSFWNDKLVNLELVELDAAGFNIGLTGFSDEELEKRIGKTAPDDFRTFDETIPTEFECPKCHYSWSGTAKPPTE